MKKVSIVCLAVVLGFLISQCFAQEQNAPGLKVVPSALPSAGKKIILLIAEQNIEGPQHAWWASEIDLSTAEAAAASKLIAQGYELVEPMNLNGILKQKPAFRMVNITENDAVKLGDFSKADYVILGKAVASAGGNVPQSNMRSCFANISAKVIQVKDNKVIAYLDASGSTVHLDVISGGKEALKNAGDDLAAKLIEALNKAGGK